MFRLFFKSSVVCGVGGGGGGGVGGVGGVGVGGGVGVSKCDFIFVSTLTNAIQKQIYENYLS
jgi:hypothetical protein